MDIDLYVLHMKGPDVVLGIQWLQKLGKVTHDYGEQTMEFTLVNTTYTLKGDESLRMKRISLHHMHALLETDEIYGIYELHFDKGCRWGRSIVGECGLHTPLNCCALGSI